MIPTQPLSCTHCRAQKRKCSRENPTCSLCHRLGYDCCYPSRRQRYRPEQATRHASEGQNIIRAQSLIWNGNLTSEVNGLQLLDAYFSLFIPSSFVFRPQRIKCRYIEGNISICVRDSIFAMAAHLLRSSPAVHASHLSTDDGIVTETEPLGENWAQQASIMVAQQTHQSPLDVLQTLFNLIVYWCAVGKAQNCRDNAKRALLLAQSIETEATPLPLDVAREFEQACFFVSMISKCVPENSELIAPHHGIPKKRLSWKASELDTERPLRGQMMELIEHWLKIRHFARSLDVGSDPGTQWGRLFNLDSETRQMYDAFPPALRTSDVPQHHQNDFRESLGLQTLYHMCRFVPHLAMILYLRVQKPSATDYTQLCAQIAVRHINYVSDTIMNCVASGQASLPTLPPFVAYCSFISVSVYLNYLNRQSKDWSSSEDLTLALPKARLLSNLYLLNQLRRLWAPVRVMWEVLQSELEMGGVPIAEVVAHGRSSTAMFSRAGWETSQASSAQHHVESRLIMEFSDVVASIKLFDPAYILVGVFRLFPVAVQASIVSCSITDDQSTELRGFAPQDGIGEQTNISASAPFIPHSQYLHDRQHQQTESSATSNYVSQRAMDQGYIPLLDRHHGPSLRNAEMDPATSVRMLEMMWLGGEDLFWT